MKKHYATHVEDTDKLISVAGPILEYKTWYEQYKKLMEEQAQRKYGLYTPTSEGGDDFDPSSFDQAWTVVGKTNEDEDRATIANITGNGNDLKLTNFGFAEGSGYGLYGENYNDDRWIKSTNRADITWMSYSVNVTSVKIAVTQLYYQSRSEQPSFTVSSYKIKVYGLKDGQTLSYRQATPEGVQMYKISEDGIYTLPSFLFKANGDWYGFILNKIQESCDITIEQIPEYEGYLVTDGVDDKIISSNFVIGDNWTVSGLIIYINTGSSGMSINDTKSLKAVCSDGRIYLDDWSEVKNTQKQDASDIEKELTIGNNGSNFTKIAFKNLGIYNRILSKEDCIKAYNYLQTLKAK